MMTPLIGGLQKTTNYKVVLPFYVYAALGFLLGTTLLLFSTEAVVAHYFNPHILAITHTMALAWGTMIIFGASHQLLPVLVEGKLDSDPLAYLTFGFTAVGIPLLIYGFYVFDMGLPPTDRCYTDQYRCDLLPRQCPEQLLQKQSEELTRMVCDHSYVMVIHNYVFWPAAGAEFPHINTVRKFSGLFIHPCTSGDCRLVCVDGNRCGFEIDTHVFDF